MKLSIYQIDAFAERVFTGNPAAVIPLDSWLSDELMQALAEENNLSETVFFVPNKEGFDIRWFTPNQEVKLCGHATLASAFVLFNELGYQGDTIKFNSLSGSLLVTKKDDLLTLDFPAQVPEVCEVPEMLVKGLGVTPLECLKNEDFVAVLANEEAVANVIPNHYYLKQVDLRGVIITSPSQEYDFVARFFASKYDVLEDPVTGSAYTQLAPYWANKLSKTALSAKQISPRGGELWCEWKGDRVLISGKAVKYSEGVVDITL